MIDPAKALNRYEAGTPPGAEPRTAAVSSEVAGTTHFVAVDGAGNIVSMTSTVEGPFGSQLIANGYFLNNELTDFTFAPEKNGAKVANRVQPGKRPLSSMSPHIVYDAADRPVLAVGSAGGKRIIMHVTKALIGVIDFGLPAGDALALPNIYFGNGSLMVGRQDRAGRDERGAGRVRPAGGGRRSGLEAQCRAVQGWRMDRLCRSAQPRGRAGGIKAAPATGRLSTKASPGSTSRQRAVETSQSSAVKNRRR